MINFEAVYYDGKLSRARRVRVEAADGWLCVRPREERDGAPVYYPLSAIRINPPLGGGVRSITLPGEGGILESNMLFAVEALEKSAGSNRAARLLAATEARWKTALAALFALLLAFGLASRYLIPALADLVAGAIPEASMEGLTDRALAELDRGMFKPSGLDGWRRARIGETFAGFCEKAGQTPAPRLVFRSMEGSPNAFALPAGVIVLTDQMADFVDSEDELLAVLAHELAHQRQKHALRQLFRNSGVYLMVSLALGDATSIAATAATLPQMLIERGYTREFETEADDLGIELMAKAGSNPPGILAFMERLLAKHPDAPDTSLFSTHPSTAKRIERLKARLAPSSP